MLKKLKRELKELYYLKNNKKVIISQQDIDSGNISGISGNVSGISGDVSDIRGNVDDCMITDEERKKGVDIRDLIE